MERDEQLIEAVRDYPCLYNSKSADFKVLLKKENAWTAVAARMQRTVEDCQKRWKVLRERFVKEIRKKQTKSGQGVVTCVPWELLNHMEFLREFVKHRKSEGNVMIAAEESEQQQGPGEVREEPQDLQKGGDMSDSEPSLNTSATSLATFSATTTPCPRKRPKRALSPDDFDREILKELRKDSWEKDEDNLFGLSIGASMKKMAPQQKASAKITIQQVLYEIEYGHSQYYPPSDTPMY